MKKFEGSSHYDLRRHGIRLWNWGFSIWVIAAGVESKMFLKLGKRRSSCKPRRGENTEGVTKVGGKHDSELERQHDVEGHGSE